MARTDDAQAAHLHWSGRKMRATGVKNDHSEAMLIKAPFIVSQQMTSETRSTQLNEVGYDCPWK